MKPLLAILCCFTLVSCGVGYTYNPSISYEDAAGHKISAEMTIVAPSEKSPRNVLSK